ncbi:MAG: RNA methyltransferase [Lysobacteraceae bacterium]
MPDPAPQPERDLRIVLIGTSHPGNVGAAARAMQTMGLDALHLVAPQCDPFSETAHAMAAGAERVMSALRVHDTLDQAIGDCLLVFGATARRRSVALQESVPREAAAKLFDAAAQGGAALLFGRERTGLENHELQRCHGAVHIPSDPAFGSLNLAAAVQVLAYELRLAQLAGDTAAPVEPSRRSEPPASQADMERFFEHLSQTLVDIDFHKGRHDVILMQRLRRLFLRAAPDMRELRILRGILGESQRMARLAGQNVERED